jgi:hypothetical protein
MNIPRGNVVNLLRKEEMSGLLGRDITSSEWTKAKRIINRDKELWTCVDSVLMMIVDEIGKERL